MLQSDIKPVRSYSDPYYQTSNLSACFLSIQIGRDGLSLAVLDTDTNTYILLKEYIFEDLHSDIQVLEEFKQIIEVEESLKQGYHNTVIGLIGGKSVLIPEALFDPKKTETYLNFSHDIKSDYTIGFDALINVRANNVFGIHKSLYDSIKLLFPSANLMHASSPLIESLSLQFKHDKGEKVVLHIQYSHFELLYFKDANFQFYNTFNYTTGEDMIYYILFVFEQLGLNGDKVKLLVLGEMEEHGHTSELLRQYIRNVEFGERSLMIKYSQVLDVIPKHYYFNLFHQFLCA